MAGAPKAIVEIMLLGHGAPFAGYVMEVMHTIYTLVQEVIPESITSCLTLQGLHKYQRRERAQREACHGCKCDDRPRLLPAPCRRRISVLVYL